MNNFGYAGHSCIVHGLSGVGKETLVVYLACVSLIGGSEVIVSFRTCLV